MTVWWKQYATKMGLGRFVDIDKLKPEHGAFVVAWVNRRPAPALPPPLPLSLPAVSDCHQIHRTTSCRYRDLAHPEGGPCARPGTSPRQGGPGRGGGSRARRLCLYL